MIKGNIRQKILIPLIVTFVLTIPVIAGSLVPASSPAASMYTLDDILNKISSNTGATLANHAFAPATIPTPSLNTLTDIWNTVSWRSLNNSGVIDAGFYSTSSLSTAEPNLIAANIATGTSLFGVVGTCVRLPEEIATLNLSAMFPSRGTGVCVQSSRSTTTGQYPFDVILKAKTDVSADDYLTINGVTVVPTSLYGFCGNDRIVSSATSAGTNLLTVPANTPIVISNVDTIGVSTGASGIISILRVY